MYDTIMLSDLIKLLQKELKEAGDNPVLTTQDYNTFYKLSKHEVHTHKGICYIEQTDTIEPEEIENEPIEFDCE